MKNRYLVLRLPSLMLVAGCLSAVSPAAELEIHRPVRHWEFMNAVGPRAAVLGRESGEFEAWVYPLKLLADFRLDFKLNGRMIPAASVVRSVLYRPGSTTLIYSGDYYAEHFLVRQTFVVPPDLPGVLIRLSIESSAPLRLDAGFRRDFTLMWPAGLGGTYGAWDESLSAFVLGEDLGRFHGLIGSPDGSLLRREYGTNYSADPRSAFTLGTLEGRHERAIALAASFDGREALESTYRALLADPAALEFRTERHYREYLERLPKLSLPDTDFEQAYQWSMLSLVKGLVDNPFLEGRGLVAGFGLSKGEARPGFAWFFGRDTCWSTLALTVAGDHDSARDAIRFIAQFQREDGKIPHEVSQSAPFVPWFDQLSYAYASADAASLYIIAVHDYLAASDDGEFLRESRPKLEKAIAYLESVEDEAGFARNREVGHGWVEGGPLLPIRTEFYQAGLYVEALRAMAEMARRYGDAETAARFDQRYRRMREALESTYWLEPAGHYAFAVDLDGRAVDEPGTLATVPMWFGLARPDRARRMLRELAGEDHIADWGSRIISSRSSRYGPAGYHFGSVWPLFTGWSSVGAYRYHAAHSGYANLAANVGLALGGSGGHTTEVLSGAVYSPLSTSSSHQIWSAAMVVSPLMRGLLGIALDAPARQVDLTPHLPAHWDGFQVQGLALGEARLDVSMRRTSSSLTLMIGNRGADSVTFRFRPALAPSARISSVVFHGQSINWVRRDGGQDWHPELTLEVPPGESTLEMEFVGDFAVTAPAPLPVFGEPSRNLKVLSEEWSEDGSQVRLTLSGRPGRSYWLQIRGEESVKSVEGAVWEGGRLEVRIPAADSDAYRQQMVTIRLENSSE